MKRSIKWALLALVMCLFAVPLAYAQTEAPDQETMGLLWIVATSIGSLIAGAVVKKVPGLPNELIPHINTTVGSLLFVTLGGLGPKEAVLAAMAAAHGATMAAELGTLAKKSSEGGGQ